MYNVRLFSIGLFAGEFGHYERTRHWYYSVLYWWINMSSMHQTELIQLRVVTRPSCALFTPSSIYSTLVRHLFQQNVFKQTQALLFVRRHQSTKDNLSSANRQMNELLTMLEI